MPDSQELPQPWKGLLIAAVLGVMIAFIIFMLLNLEEGERTRDSDSKAEASSSAS